MSRSRVFARILLVAAYSLVQAGGQDQSCSVHTTGSCRVTQKLGYVEICASGRWQEQGSGGYSCRNGVLALMVSNGIHEKETTVHQETLTYSAIKPQDTSSEDDSACYHPGDTGASRCGVTPSRCRSDAFGKATFQTQGKMASVYDAPPSSAFRCDMNPPADGFYLAMWTAYNASLAAQPPPNNCGQYLVVRNPKTGVQQRAMVIDRCASCVGVGYQTSDPTTPDSLSNGATVDLSRMLWNKLFDNAPASVYDIEYDAPTYDGWHSPPEKMTAPNCGPILL